MDKNRLFVMGAVLAMAVIVLLGWTLGVQPPLAASVAAAKEAKAVQAENARQAEVLAVLKKDYANLGTLQKQRDELRKAVPAGTDMSAFIDELHAVMSARGVTLGSFTVAGAQAYVAPKAAPPAAGAAPAAGTPSGKATPAPSAEPAPEGLVLIPIQLTVKGTYPKVLDFVHGLQTGTRLVLVTTLTTSQSSAGAGQEVTASIGGFAYVLTDK